PVESQGSCDFRGGVRGAGRPGQSSARLVGRNAAGRVPGSVSRISGPARQAFRAAPECGDCDGKQRRQEICADAEKTLREFRPGGRAACALGAGEAGTGVSLNPSLMVESRAPPPGRQNAWTGEGARRSTSRFVHYNRQFIQGGQHPCFRRICSTASAFLSPAAAPVGARLRRNVFWNWARKFTSADAATKFSRRPSRSYASARAARFTPVLATCATHRRSKR